MTQIVSASQPQKLSVGCRSLCWRRASPGQWRLSLLPGLRWQRKGEQSLEGSGAWGTLPRAPTHPCSCGAVGPSCASRPSVPGWESPLCCSLELVELLGDRVSGGLLPELCCGNFCSSNVCVVPWRSTARQGRCFCLRQSVLFSSTN